MQIRKVSTVYRGGPIQYKAQTISRIQDGRYGLGTNQSYRRVWLKTASQDRHWHLVRLQQGEKERERLWDKLDGDVEVDAAQRERRKKWLTAATKQRSNGAGLGKGG